jgi:hypothetical protein
MSGEDGGLQFYDCHPSPIVITFAELSMAQTPRREAEFFHPHQRAYVSGIYRMAHEPARCEPSDVVLVAGDVFAPCHHCNDVRYYLLQAAPHVSEDADFGGLQQRRDVAQSESKLAGERVSMEAGISMTRPALVPKRVFQITYDESLAMTRELLLQARGYHVDSALGNEAAFRMLSRGPAYDLFIIGHAAPSTIRQEMAQWLRVNYPAAKILALNPPYQMVHEVDYNIQLNGPEEWLQVVAGAVG